MNDTLRAGATAVGVAAGLLALATTAQTPDGYFHASLGGPLDVFTTNASDVLAIGDGTDDVNELASLLKGPLGPEAKVGAPNSPFRVAYEAGVAPSPTTGGDPGNPPSGATVLSLPPTQAPVPPTVIKESGAILPSKPVIDSQGRIDCSGAVSCHTDPTTNVTTVTFPDGIVAIVQTINDLTVVAYKTITDVLPNEISSLLPPVPTATPPLLAAGAPTSAITAPAPSSTPSIAPSVSAAPSTPAANADPAPEPPSAVADPAPSTPDGEPDADTGPRVNVSKPSKDFTPGRNGEAPSDTGGKPPGLGKVAGALGDVVDAVKGAVGKVLGPGASHKPESANDSQPAKPATAGDGTSDSPSGSG